MYAQVECVQGHTHTHTQPTKKGHWVVHSDALRIFPHTPDGVMKMGSLQVVLGFSLLH